MTNEEDNKTENNIWKTVTFLLILLIILMFVGIFIESNQTYRFQLEDNSTFEISKNDFNLLTKEMKYGESRNICNTELQCIKVVNIDDKIK